MLTSNPFDTIKEVLPITNILRFYGVEVKQKNKTLCPLHNEKSPSFTIYPSTNTWHCFGCGAGGSAIDFVMLYFGLAPLDAAKKLDIDFSLGLFDYKPTPEERQRLQEQKAQQQADKSITRAFEDYMDKAYSLLCDYAKLLRDWKETHAPQSIDDMDKPLHSLFVEACHKLDYIEYLLDCLIFAGLDEQIQFYETHREELLNIATRIELHTDGGEADK